VKNQDTVSSVPIKQVMLNYYYYYYYYNDVLMAEQLPAEKR